MKKIQKYKAKIRIKEMLNRVQIACVEDNLEKFEYQISEIFKLIYSNDVSFASDNTKKISEFVVYQLTTKNPIKISEKYLDEFSALYQQGLTDDRNSKKENKEEIPDNSNK